MSMFKNSSKNHHDRIQKDVKEALSNKGISVIDFAVERTIKAGENRISAIAKMFRLTPEQVKSSISPALFSVNHDTIHLA